MKASNLKLAEPPSPRSPDRQRLAAAIEARDAAQQALEAARRAVVRGGDAVSNTERRLAAAQETIEVSRAQCALAVADGVAPAAGNVRGARAAALDAEDSLAVANQALGELQKRCELAEDTLRASSSMVQALADAVIRTAAKKTLAEACEAVLKLQGCRVLLRYLQFPERYGSPPALGDRTLFTEPWGEAVHRLGPLRARRRADADKAAREARDQGFAGEVESAIGRHIELTLGELHRASENWWRAPALEAWRACREALLTDADAALPDE